MRIISFFIKSYCLVAGCPAINMQICFFTPFLINELITNTHTHTHTHTHNDEEEDNDKNGYLCHCNGRICYGRLR